MVENSREGNKGSPDMPTIEALINENKVAYTNEAQSILIGKSVTKVINDLNLIFYKEVIAIQLIGRSGCHVFWCI